MRFYFFFIGLSSRGYNASNIAHIHVSISGEFFNLCGRLMTSLGDLLTYIVLSLSILARSANLPTRP